MSKYFEEDELKNQNTQQQNTLSKILQYHQSLMDKIQFYKKERWGTNVFLTLLYILRLFLTKGFHAVTYIIGIHILNSFIGFISPLEDPDDLDEFSMGEGSFLPQKDSEDFKPFQRKVKEFEFWQSTFYALIIGIFITFNTDFDIPVHWPLLLCYFFLILFFTMRKQINHMIKYKYLPWDAGKVRY